jgi:hypothetical protein
VGTSSRRLGWPGQSTVTTRLMAVTTRAAPMSAPSAREPVKDAID